MGGEIMAQQMGPLIRGYIHRFKEMLVVGYAKASLFLLPSRGIYTTAAPHYCVTPTAKAFRTVSDVVLNLISVLFS